MNLDGLRDLLASERGVFAIALLIVSTTLLWTERMTVDLWCSYTMALAGMLITGKTVTTGIEILKRPSSPPPVTSVAVVTNAPSPPP